MAFPYSHLSTAPRRHGAPSLHDFVISTKYWIQETTDFAEILILCVVCGFRSQVGAALEAVFHPRAPPPPPPPPISSTWRRVAVVVAFA